MIALIDKEILKKEGTYLLILLFTMAAMLKIIFLSESIVATTRTAASLFWLFVLPGFALMYYWQEKLEFVERLIIGTVLGLAITGVVGYNISLLGINMKYHAIILPALMLAVGAVIVLKKKTDSPAS